MLFHKPEFKACKWNRSIIEEFSEAIKGVKGELKQAVRDQFCILPSIKPIPTVKRTGIAWEVIFRLN